MDEKMTEQVEEVTSAEEIAEHDVEKKVEIGNKKASPTLIAIIAGVAVVLLAIVILLIALGGKENGQGEEKPGEGGKSSEEIKEEQFEAAKGAYEDLVAAGDICIDIMDSIYAAWYFAIYESDDYTGWGKLIQFCSSTDLRTTDVEAAMEELGFTSTSYYIFDEFSYAVTVVEQVFITKGIYTTAEQHLSDAKDSLKQVTSEYSDYTGYPTLKSYYSEVSSYLEFAKSPSGSFSQLKTTVDNYETNMRTYKNDLSFIFE